MKHIYLSFTRLIVLIFVYQVVITSSHAQTSFDNLYATNGRVDAVVVSGNTIYIGGEFTYVGPNTGAGASIDKTTGAFDPDFPKVNGTILTVVPDGSGGWYIGGEFTAVEGITRNGIAHILANKSLDPGWNPNAVGQTATVWVLAVSGSTIYTGGAFNSIGGQSRNNIAALDMSSGSATSWNPNAPGSVYALTISGTTVFAGGDFSGIIGGQTRNYLAALDVSTGSATSWNPNANYIVHALATSGTTVYAGGEFTSIGGQVRNQIAALDASTGSATSWNPNAVGNGGTVYALAVSGSTVYAGGYFTTIGGQARNRIAALDATTGNATSWNPNAGGNFNALPVTVYAITVSGSTVYAGGRFSSIGGQSRNYIAALDATTGSATNWNPNAGSTVYTLAGYGSTVYAGGLFNSIGGLTRNYIAALDATTGSATSWNPNANYIVNALAVSGSTVYAGGGFTNIGGLTRNGIAALDVLTGSATSWNPNTVGSVYALAVSGSIVYAGGSFIGIGGQTRNRIAALDASTGSATSWNPNANNLVYTLAVAGSIVYAGGSFSSIGGQGRSGIAAVDASTGSATSWNPNTAGGTIWALAISGSTVYAGGNFNSIGGLTRYNIAALDASTGSATSWDPYSNDFVKAIAISGEMIYAGGFFNSIGGVTRNNIAALDPLTGNATSWNPNAKSPVWSIALDFAKGRVYAGGDFRSVLNKAHGQFVGLTNPIDILLPVEKEIGLATTGFSLIDNYPNPFEQTTKIRYETGTRQMVSLKVYDLYGKEITTLVNEIKPAGIYEVTFNASKTAPGIYICKLQAGLFKETKIMIQLK